MTLGGITDYVYFRDNAQIQYLTPTIVYPEPTFSGDTVQIPVVLSGFETAYLQAALSFTPVANISINLPGTLNLSAEEAMPGQIYMYASFGSAPVPEPEGVALAGIGLLVLLAGYTMPRRRTPL